MKPNILTLIPLKANMHADLKARGIALASRLPAANPDLNIVNVFDFRHLPKEDGDCRPWSKVTRVRNTLIECFNLNQFSHVLWIDADLVEYPADLPTRLLATNATGISSLPVYIEDREHDFYDWAAFIGLDLVHWGHPFPHHRDVVGKDVVDVAGVGCVYTCPVDIYLDGARHEDHPTNTDHWPICEAARAKGQRVTVDMRMRALHANLPKYGEAWH